MPKNRYGYGTMFKDLEPFYPDRADLDSLATIMSGAAAYPDAEISNLLLSAKKTSDSVSIPAGYTYLAQFIAHDISFDEASDRHTRKDFPLDVIGQESIRALRNLRNPFFDLEAIYGSEGPKILRSDLLLPRSNSTKLPLFRLGDTKGVTSESVGASYSYPNDLPRKNASVDAKIIDPRNDENLLLAQTQVAFTKFHNALVVKYSKTGSFSYEKLYENARKLAIRAYQTIVLEDFLPQIVDKTVLKDVKEKAATTDLFYQPTPENMFIPLEFSVAAFRFGHSMIRNDYDLNSLRLKTPLYELMKFTGRSEMGSKPSPGKVVRLNLPSNWIIDWNRFFVINGSTPIFAEPIDTRLPSALLKLRPLPAHLFGGRASSLAALDLYRGRRFGLPTGQSIAGKIGAKPLTSGQIEMLINQMEVQLQPQANAAAISLRLRKAFSEKTPLWFYILAEAELTGAGKLGDVGSRIVAETMVTLLYLSEASILKEKLDVDELRILGVSTSFEMADMLKLVQETNVQYHSELYPKQYYPDTQNNFDELRPV